MTDFADFFFRYTTEYTVYIIRGFFIANKYEVFSLITGRFSFGPNKSGLRGKSYLPSPKTSIHAVNQFCLLIFLNPNHNFPLFAPFIKFALSARQRGVARFESNRMD
jgi:hypothetical protein